MQLCVASYNSSWGCAARDLASEVPILTSTCAPHLAFDIMSEAAASQPAPSSSSSTAPTVLNKHAPTPVEQQRLQLERLLKDPSKPAHVPKAPVEKTLRTPREMMKNVQGSSAGESSFRNPVVLAILGFAHAFAIFNAFGPPYLPTRTFVLE